MSNKLKRDYRNRHERRAARKRGFDLIIISFGRYQAEGLLPKLRVCSGCGGEAKPWPYEKCGGEAYGVAEVEGSPDSDGLVPVCEACFAAPAETCNTIMRWATGAPELKIHDGGKLESEEQLADIMSTLAEKRAATEH